MLRCGGRLLPLAMVSLLAACSVIRPGPRPPPLPAGQVPPPSNINAIPDAVPRVEPRSARGNPPFYEALGHRYYVMASAAGYVETGVASWYGPNFHARSTSSGEPYDMYGMTAAHKTLPLPTYVRVTNLSNGRSVVVRVNDRGPFVANRVIDLSYTAAAKLDMIRSGTAVVEVRALTPGTLEAGQPVLPAPQALAAATPLPPAALPSPVTAPVVPVPRPATPVPAEPALPSVSFFLQAGAFADPRNAQGVLARLQEAGISDAFVLQPPEGSSLYRVRVGPLSSVDDIDRRMEQLTRLGFGEARVVTAN